MDVYCHLLICHTHFTPLSPLQRNAAPFHFAKQEHSYLLVRTTGSVPRWICGYCSDANQVLAGNWKLVQWGQTEGILVDLVNLVRVAG